MRFISYAQNFEDVMLWRALKEVRNGFYIDVGANHPTIDSVTKAFYERGWNGINIEPEKELYDLLKGERPKDINLNIAISASVKSIEFYVSKVRGWSTTDQNISDTQKKKGTISEIRTIEAKSLDQICNEYHQDEVHFLKIDVEGAEKDVLESFSFQEVRPWILVIEATKPGTPIDISSEWESIITAHQYTFVYFDGLNKYYIADEHKELTNSFRCPPNVFDDFVMAAQVEAEAQRDEAKHIYELQLCRYIKRLLEFKQYIISKFVD